MGDLEFQTLLDKMGLTPKQTQSYNCITNRFGNFIEIVYYKQEFNVTTGNCSGVDLLTGELLVKSVDRTRKFTEIDGVLTPTTNNIIKIDAVQQTIKNGRKRALDNIYGYVLANKWYYFVTLTFDPTKVDRDDEEDIKYAWKKFRQKLQYVDRQVKIFAIPERHPTSGKLHLHVLVGNIYLDNYLNRAINPHTNKPINSKGRAVYNLNLFEYGFSTLVKIDGNELVVANYLSKYVVKDFGTLGYNKKSYYATRNLNFKNKELSFVNKQDFLKMQQDLKYDPCTTLVKDTEKLTIYRIELPFKNN